MVCTQHRFTAHPPTKIQTQNISLRRKTQGPSLHLLVLGAGWAPVLQLGQDRELKAGVEGRGSGETSVAGCVAAGETAEVGGGEGVTPPPHQLALLQSSPGVPSDCLLVITCIQNLFPA